jgi:hypothetical protein
VRLHQLAELEAGLKGIRRVEERLQPVIVGALLPSIDHGG